MKPLFNSIKVKAPKRNSFDLSYDRKLSFDMGELIPIMVQECVPGDRFKVGLEQLIRLAPTLSPMMHRVNVFAHAFKVPNRLVWDNWQNYITGGADGAQNPTHPVLEITDATKQYHGVGSLTDYMGVPPAPTGTIGYQLNVNALPFRAYQLIWDEYYRDQTLQTKSTITKNDTITPGSPEHTGTAVLRKRCWEKDYFTSALPWAQRTGSSVIVPSTVNYKTGSGIQMTLTQSQAGGQAIQTNTSGTQTTLTTAGGAQISKIENLNGVDITVTDLRRALKLQQWFERNATAGARYIEQIMAHFGVKTSDARLQRPEYLGGAKVPMTISEVVSMVNDAAGSHPQGTLTGHGVSVGSNHLFDTYCEEHGWIFIIMSVLPKTQYQQGCPRKFSKVDRYDYFWPEFENIGEQVIKMKEVYKNWSADTGNNTFGYAPRYAEYKYNPSTCHGDFRDTLNFWHMGRIFESEPALNASFVEADPTNRVFASLTNDHLWCQAFVKVNALRPMSVFSTPSL